MAELILAAKLVCHFKFKLCCCVVTCMALGLLVACGRVYC